MDVSPARPRSSRFDSGFPLRAFFGHHKCATSWITRIVMEVCFRLGLNLEIVHREDQFTGHSSLQSYLEERDADFLAYTNAKGERLADLGFHRGFHVVRDPRDVLVSAYFSHLHSHPTDDWPELKEHRARLEALSEKEGLRAEMDFSADEFQDMLAWDYDRDDVVELKLEHLSPRPIDGFTCIIRFLEMLDRGRTSGIDRSVKSAGLAVNRFLYKGRHILPTDGAPTVQTWPSIPESTLHKIIRAKSFENLSGGREKGEEDVESHFRKGVPGDWKNHFDRDLTREFKDRYNDLLLKLGYESDADWQC